MRGHNVGALLLVLGCLFPQATLAETQDVLPSWARPKSDEAYQHIVVEKVLTGDLLLLENGEKIRLIGLRAPDKPARRHQPVDQHGFIIKEEDPSVTVEERAMDFVRTLLEGKTVRLEFDADRRDDEFYTVAYVFTLDPPLLANAEILRQGYAFLSIRPPNMKYAEALRAAYREARQEHRGLQGE